MQGPVEFQTVVPVDDDGLKANVRHALGLGLPDLRDFEYPWQEPLHVIANGPSAWQAPIADRSLKTVALNNALSLFPHPPTYWAACDPQPLVADFLTAHPEQTVYLVASKCHPSVFERLQGHEVILWHVADSATWPILQDRFPVQAWTSITICIPELFARLGFRRFDMWGWDGCILDGAENAVSQLNNEGRITLDVAGQKFETCHTWALEAQSAVTALAGFPFPVHVHGPGMVAAILKAFLPKRILTDAT
jgi:hypothetical protein